MKISPNHYSVREHPSVVIFPDGGWYRYSNGQYNKSALNYLTDVRGLDFMSACRLFDNFSGASPKPSSVQYRDKEQERETRTLYLPMKDKHGDEKMRAYLKSRGIGASVVSSLVRRRVLYQGWTRGYGPCCVFVGYDYKDLNDNGVPKAKHGSRRYIEDDRVRRTLIKELQEKEQPVPGDVELEKIVRKHSKRDAAGSDKAFSMYLPWSGQTREFSSAEYGKVLHVFEGPVDLLSGIMIQCIDSCESSHPETPETLLAQNAYLLLSGVAPSKAGGGYIPAALGRVMEELHSSSQLGEGGISRIVLHLDADEAGRLASGRIAEQIEGKYRGIRVTDVSLRYEFEGVKDENEALLSILNRKGWETLSTRPFAPAYSYKPATYKPVSNNAANGAEEYPAEESEHMIDR
jgi:hypothetical protein